MVRYSFRIARRLVTDPAGSGREIVRRLKHSPDVAVAQPIERASGPTADETAAYNLRSQLNRAEARLVKMMQDLAEGRLHGNTPVTDVELYALKASEGRLLGKVREYRETIAEQQARLVSTLLHRQNLEQQLAKLERLEADAQRERQCLEAQLTEQQRFASDALRERQLLEVQLVEQHHLASERQGLVAQLTEQQQLVSENQTERQRLETQLLEYRRLADELEEAAQRATDTKLAHEAQIDALRAEHVAALQRLATELEVERARNDHIATNLLALKTQLTSEMQSFRYQRSTTSERATQLYLDLIEKVLTGEATTDPSGDPWSPKKFDPLRRQIGRDWPQSALTMIGTARMRNLRLMCEKVIAENVPGDFIETGVWRGGACIYMRAILLATEDKMRRVFVADSFKGLPEPDEASFPADKGDAHHTYQALAVSSSEVAANFRRFNLLDDRVVFLEGWFKDTLPAAPIERLAVLRLDGDMYESTIQALDALYFKVSPGGIVIVDDYILPPCAKAIDDFRAKHKITAKLHEVDGAAVWWQVTAGPEASSSS